MKEFASGHARTKEGWVVFPEDSGLRKAHFPQEVMGHPAKANLYMIESIVEYVSEPGDMIIDPMSGTGSIMVAAVMGRPVVCIEVEEGYHQLQRRALDEFTVVNPELRGLITLIHGDCMKILPLPCNHVVFSPPYAGILKMKGGAVRESTRSLAGSYKDTIQDYSTNRDNVGTLNKFLYNQVMEKVYRLCLESIRPGGTMTIILQDYYGKEYGERKRIYLSDWLLRCCIKMGFQQDAWFKRKASGTGFKRLWASRGYDVVEDEDIVVFRRP